MTDDYRNRFDILRPGVKGPQPTYEFVADSVERLEEITGGVECLISLVNPEGRHTNPNEARERINVLYENKVGFIGYNGSASVLVAKTDIETYDHLRQPGPELSDIIAYAHLNENRWRVPE